MTANMENENMTNEPPTDDNVVLFPVVTDAQFLDAIVGLSLCLKEDQEARLSIEQLQRLARMARAGMHRP